MSGQSAPLQFQAPDRSSDGTGKSLARIANFPFPCLEEQTDLSLLPGTLQRLARCEEFECWTGVGSLG